MLPKPVDAYANCFVRRRRPTQTIEPAEPTDAGAPAAAAAPPRASTLALRNLLAKPASPNATPDLNPNDQEPR